MANPSRVSPIRIETRALQCVSIPDYSSVSSLEEDYGSTESEDMSTSPDTSYRSSADADKNFDPEEDFRKELVKLDDIIEKIENLRFVRVDHDDDDDDDDNDDDDDDVDSDQHSNFDEDSNVYVGKTSHRVTSENVDNVEYRNTCELPRNRQHTDNEDINNNEDNGTVEKNEAACQSLNIHDEVDDEERRYSQEDQDSVDEEAEQEHEDSDDSDLIERGPIKPDIQTPFRGGHPYSIRWQSIDNTDAIQADASHTLDYDKTAEQIMRNKYYSEKLNPCLDELSKSSRNQMSMGTIIGSLTMNSGWVDKTGDGSVFRNESVSDTAALPSIVVNPTEESLMDILSQNILQPAVLSDAGSHSIPSPGAKTWSNSPASSYNYVVSRSNSRASSRAQSPGSATNLESPQMHVNVIDSPLGSPQVASTYRVPQALSSSSSSNQSYGDASSPCNYQVPLSYQAEEQLDDCFDALSGWKESYDSSGTIANSSETIDCDTNDLLQMVEQMIEQDKQQEVLKEPQIASNAPYFPSTYATQCVPARTSHTNPNPTECTSNELGRASKPENSGLGMSNANPMVHSLIDGSLVSVYTMKEGTGGYTFVNRAVDGHAIGSEQRYYEPVVKAAQYDNGLCSIAGLNTPDSSTKNRGSPGLCTSQKYALPHVTDGDERYNHSSTMYMPSDYQIPTMVSSFVSASRPQRKPYQSIKPWPMLNLPSVRASERLKEVLHPKEVERAMNNLLKKPIEELASADEDGDTSLMILMGNPNELKKKMAHLVPLVERLSSVRGALAMVNNRGEDALYLAAMNCPEMSYVTGYLAAAMMQKQIDMNRLYHMRGDTLIHSVAARGDSHGEVLAELLALKKPDGKSAFDLSRCNYNGKTALHVAIESHSSIGRDVKCLATTRLLLENGASARDKESRCGDTALHMAVSLSCDPALVKVLLCHATPDVVNETNYMYNTPLHMAAAVSNAVSLEKQKEVCLLLIQAGGQTNIQNRQGRTPLALVSADRKEVIKKVFYKKS
ncbi:uncharacterized protein LOC105187954 [Harpegnathos saltator]|uniref:NF-kappa-B inhibitor zeta n=1 Tax=Harpegnathos saltator TaxID=610380 RepID=E2BYG7_HARSA|nr:uncharacterized protein LOC105187954 [Harpegnathos saltator]EFN79251.1 NF-kappa-B inhibitor zeta [Harpegnathos saltator]